jgi:hypothetical protein
MILLSCRITTENPKVQEWTFHAAIPKAARNRRKMAAKAGLIEDNRPPTPFTMSSESDRSPQLAENTGFESISSLRFECAKLFVDLLRCEPTADR